MCCAWSVAGSSYAVARGDPAQNFLNDMALTSYPWGLQKDDVSNLTI